MTPLPPELLARHSAPGPRYTSYPTVMHWGAAPTGEAWLAALAEALAGAQARAGLYVHIPFCQSLCTFCGCNMRLVRNHALAAPYVETVLREFALYRQGLGAAALPLGELHLGGGSPSYLPAATLDRLLDGLLAHAAPANDADLVFEADPRNTTREQLAVLRRHGFNALSIGVQDFDPRVLEIVNRAQSAEQVRALVDTARELGFARLSVDLIFGLPLQTTDSLRHTFDTLARLRPERVSFLPYAHVPWIKPSQRRYTEADLPDAALRQQLFQLGRAELGAAGYVEIGFDQYALPTDPLATALAAGSLQRSFMGFSAARTDALLGLGVSAIGAAHRLYAQNEKSLQQYEARLAAGELPLQRGCRLSAEDQRIRELLWALFTASRATHTADDHAAAWWPDTAAALRALARDDLITLTDDAIELCPVGRAFLRQLGVAFDEHLRHTRP